MVEREALGTRNAPKDGATKTAKEKLEVRTAM